MTEIVGIKFNETEVMLAVAAFHMLPMEQNPAPDSLSLREKSIRLRKRIQEIADAHAS